jgi:hypothetical protein
MEATEKQERTRIQNRIAHIKTRTQNRKAFINCQISNFAQKLNKSISTGTVDRRGKHKKCDNIGPDPEL